MGLNETPAANRIHIAFFGRRNTGKSSLVNAVTGQDLAVVSEVKGTTTDPVRKAMELLPLGPVLITDTPGIDDEGPLGELRMRRTRQELNKTDVAVLVLDASEKTADGGLLQDAEKELLDIFQAKGIPCVIAANKSDLLEGSPEGLPGGAITVSAKNGDNIPALKERIAALAATGEPPTRLVGDLIQPADLVLLVTPIDQSAPKGRLILPQQQTIRDILEAGGVAVAAQEGQLRETMKHLGKKPSLVVTDSQVFAEVAAELPPEIPLTSFSILFARYKGGLESAARGLTVLDHLRSGDKILIAEGCTHHRQCEDIGTVKLPRWIKNYRTVEPEFCFCSGGEFPEDLSAYALIIHCGGCMLNDREMQYRRRCAEDQLIPFTNYGMVIAQVQGILRRSLAVFSLQLTPPPDA
ncbi:MAG: [FeFe] hydrogenase H-cluster maturation GTPase HydF [Desulfovibrionaceae bacterium]|nr:[FeFe] hydrogenase H-cluster maturation GTPase HydF [Desulfovibrionaceae bacterium]